MKIWSWLADFFTLRPVCSPIFFQIVWLVFLAVEAVSFVSLVWGTFGVYPKLSVFPWAVLAQVPWILVQVLLVRIFLEMAAKVLASGR